MPKVRFGKILYSLLPLLGAQLGDGVSAKELLLQYDVTTKEKLCQTGNSEVRAKPHHAGTASVKRADTEQSRQHTTIGLGNRYFFVEQPDHVQIYFLDQKIVRDLCPNTKTYSDSPLFAILSYRKAELENRLMINAALSKIGAQSNLQNEVELESLFSLKGQGQIGGPLIDEKAVSDGKEFLYKNKLIAAYQQDQMVLDPAYRESFAHFLTYCCTLYPGVQHKLAQNEHVLRQLNFETNNTPISISSTHFQLISAAESDIPRYDSTIPEGYTEDTSANPLHTLKARLAKSPPKPANVRLKESINEAQAALTKGNKLEAFLCLCEYQLETGNIPDIKTSDEPLKRKIVQIQQAVASDPKVRKLKPLVGMGRCDSNNVTGSFQWLNKQDSRKWPKAYVVEALRANYKLASGDTAAAIKESLAALSKNPYMIYSYYVLGIAYSNEFQTPLAWSCWTFAKKLVPEPNNLSRKVDDWEQLLVKSYPQYF